MVINRKTKYGKVEITSEAIAELTGGIVMESYGVVGMASQKPLKDGIAELLKRNNYAKGIVVKGEEDNLEIDLYISVSYGTKISEVVNEVQKKVKYVLEKTLEIKLQKVNVFVQSVKEVK